MSEVLTGLTPFDLRALATAVRSGALAAPYAPVTLARLLPDGHAAAASAELGALGLPGPQLAAVLELLARAADARPGAAEAVQLVTTGPGAAAAGRDTGVVMAEMFRVARSSLLIAGYAVHRARPLLQVLAARKAEVPGLEVRLCLDIQRKPGDNSLAAGVVHRFLQRFAQKEWPAGVPLPEIFYDPRALAPAGAARAVLHAKCVVADRAVAFVSSANLTQAAQERNIEVGLRVASPAVAASICAFFDGLVASGALRRAR